MVQQRHDSLHRCSICLCLQVGGWKGTTDTHELIEKTHEKFLEEKKKKRIKGKQHATPPAASATAEAAERRVKHVMD